MTHSEAETESIDPRYGDIDAWPTQTILTRIYEDQLAAVQAVDAALPSLARAVEDAARVLCDSGRLVYAGAGTSGRIGVQDGAELVPTFNWRPERLLFLIAGGTPALTRSFEGAEDSEADAARAVDEAKIGSQDVVIGAAASGTTPYTVAALRTAREAGAVTIGISNSANSPLLQTAQHPIFVATGGEAIAGSTRMKAGTAQKVVLTLFSTALMVRLGRVYRGMMVEMRASNAKLRRRAAGIVSAIAGCSPEAAAGFVDAAKGELKLAILLARGMAPEEAGALLESHRGNLRAIMATLDSHG